MCVLSSILRKFSKRRKAGTQPRKKPAWKYPCPEMSKSAITKPRITALRQVRDCMNQNPAAIAKAAEVYETTRPTSPISIEADMLPESTAIREVKKRGIIPTLSEWESHHCAIPAMKQKNHQVDFGAINKTKQECGKSHQWMQPTTTQVYEGGRATFE